MKTKRSTRILSILLTVITLVGTLPLSAVPATAAEPSTSTGDIEWTVIGGEGTTESDYDLFQVLRNEMNNGTGVKKYIRLGEDIDYSQSYNYTIDDWTPIRVGGDVILDLNGYRLDVTYSVSEAQESMYLDLFSVGYSAANTKLTVVDSRGKGEIHTNGYIRDYKMTSYYHLCHVFNIFRVYAGAELVINAPGATFRCGRSKKQWVAYNPYDGHNKTEYTGYVYNQICGSVVILNDNSDLTVAGGKLQARGYLGITSGGTYGPCAAVYGDGENININIIDGIFYGKGGASAIFVGNVVDYSRNVTIHSGTFDVFKLNKIVVGSYDHDEMGYGDYRLKDGEYGDIGIPDSLLDKDNSDIVIGGHNYSEDEDDTSANYTHKTTVIKPKTNSKTPDDRILVESATGIGSWNGKDSYIINAKNGRSYFTDAERKYLDDDLQKDTNGFYVWTFTLYDAETGEKCDAEPMQVSKLSADDAVSIDLKDFKQTNTTTFKYYFENDEISSYKIKAEVQEVWAGQHTYTAKFFNWISFNEHFDFLDINEAAQSFDFEVLPKTPRSISTTYTINTLNEDGMEYYFEFLENNSQGTVRCNSYYRYHTIDSAGGTVLSAKQEIVSGVEYGDSIEFTVPPTKAGPIYVTVEYVFIRHTGSSSVVNSVTLTVTHLVYALDYMRYDILESDGDVARTSYVSAGRNNYDTVELADGETIVIKPNINADMSKMTVKDPTTGKPFDKSAIKWQFSTGLDDNGIHIWNDVPTYEIVDYNVGGVSLPCVKTNRTAWYRMSYTWNDQTYYSPQLLMVKGTSFENTRVATVVRDDNCCGIYGKGDNTLWLELNKDADWNTGGCSIDQIRVDVTARPSGATLAKTSQTLNDVTVDQNNRIKLVNTDTFFENEAGAVTGSYTFRIRISGRNANGSTYYVTTTHDLWYSQKTTDLNIYVNGTPIYEHDGIQIPCILPADTNIFDFTHGYYPLNTMGNGIDVDSIKWRSSDASILRIDEKSGHGLALRPGTVTISCTWMDMSNVSHTSSAEVRVPIAGFELDELDYEANIGYNLTNVTRNIATVKSIWSYGGEKITDYTYRYLDIELTSYNGYTNGSVNFGDATVKYNENCAYGYTVKPKYTNGYYFPVTIESDDIDMDCYVDTDLLSCDGLDNGDILPISSYGASIEWNMPYRVHIDYSEKTCEELYMDNMYVNIRHSPRIDDPDAIYLNEVNISVSEPAVGDNRYEGAYENGYNEYLILNVSGAFGSRKRSDSHSYVSKLDISNMRGTGKAYDDASIEEKGALASEYMSVWNMSGSTLNKPTKTYEQGIYVHDVQLRFDGADASGSKIYVAKDAHIFVNGREISNAGIGYYSDESSVSFKYYFDVGNVETVSTVQVSGIKTPLQGDLPAEAGDCTVKVGGSETDNVYISKLVWFVDANSNGKYDDGEEAKTEFGNSSSGGVPYQYYNRNKSTLWYDGRFLAGRAYSLYVELQADSARIDPNVAITFDGIGKSLIGSMSGVFTFPKDTVIRTVSIDAVTNGEFIPSLTYDQMTLDPGSRGTGVKISWTYNKFVECDDPNAEISEFEGDDIFRCNTMQELPEGKTWLRIMASAEDGYTMSPDVKFLVNGSEVCEEFAPGRNKIEYRTVGGNDNITIYLAYYLFTKGSEVDVLAGFTDLVPGAWYIEPIRTVVTEGIFGGVSPTTFAPDMPMTRAMFAKVLANHAGVKLDNYSTHAETFTDVKQDQWFFEAIAWAYDNGVVNGMTPTTFEPDGYITREQMCVMIVRYLTEVQHFTLPDNVQPATEFEDAAQIGSWAKDAVMACNKAGVVNGMTPTTFGPTRTATRAQVAKVFAGILPLLAH